MTDEEAWVRFAAAFATCNEMSPENAAYWADGLLTEYRKRFVSLEVAAVMMPREGED